MAQKAQLETVALLHLLEWNADDLVFDLGGGVSLRRTVGSDVERLYDHLCETRMVDNGEALWCPTHIHLADQAHDDLWLDWAGPYSVISRVCNTITLCTAVPVRRARLIVGREGLQADRTQSFVIYEQSPVVEFLAAYPDSLDVSAKGITARGERFPALDLEHLQAIRTCWQSQQAMLAPEGSSTHRVENALAFYFYAWRAYYMEQVCLNLAVGLESLFAPVSQQELSHQIAFNMSRFCAESAGERRSTYRAAKRFYSLRSSIVHGGRARQHDLFAQTPEMFHRCSGILKRVLQDSALVESFGDEKKRRMVLDGWLFGD